MRKAQRNLLNFGITNFDFGYDRPKLDFGKYEGMPQRTDHPHRVDDLLKDLTKPQLRDLLEYSLRYRTSEYTARAIIKGWRNKNGVKTK